MSDNYNGPELARQVLKLRSEIMQLRAANIGLATESHELQQEAERLRSVADAEMKLREGNFAEIERLREEVRSLGEMSDTCTFHALKEICTNCRCKRAALAPGAVQGEGAAHE